MKATGSYLSGEKSLSKSDDCRVIGLLFIVVSSHYDYHMLFVITSDESDDSTKCFRLAGSFVLGINEKESRQNNYCFTNY